MEFFVFSLQALQFFKFYENEEKHEKCNFKSPECGAVEVKNTWIIGKIALKFCKLIFLWVICQIIYKFSKTKAK